MTGFELNKALAELTHPHLEWVMNRTCDDNTTVAANGWTLNYCNNWSDLMPFVVENNITMECYHGKFDHCYYTNDDHESLYWNEGDDPQRALAECLLKVLLQCNK